MGSQRRFMLHPDFVENLVFVGFACGAAALLQPRSGKPHYVFIVGTMDTENRRDMIRKLDVVRQKFDHGWTWGLAVQASRRASHVVLWKRPWTPTGKEQ